MKFTYTTCIALAAAVAKVSADCFSTRLGFPCCSSWNKKVEFSDGDGNWGIENGSWCGIGNQQQATGGQCTGSNQGYQCCNGCKVEYTDGDGPWGVENGQWCGIKNTCNSSNNNSNGNNTSNGNNNSSGNSNTNTSVSGVPLNPPKVTGGQTGKTTRYWDCCLASCSWSENTNASHPVNACQKDGKTVFNKFDWTIGSACSGGQGYMCTDNQPWAINDNVSYGFVAAGFSSGSQKDWCCTCQRLEFTSGPVAGKQMVVQITNTGGDLSNNHFDIQMPGGGVGIFNGCQSQFGAPSDGWGERYGGVKSASDCSSLPAELQDGCKWRFDWFKNADNPSVTFERVQCPKELTDITGCIPVDDASAKKLPW